MRRLDTADFLLWGGLGINAVNGRLSNAAGNRVVSQAFALQLRSGREMATTLSLLGRLSELEQDKGRELVASHDDLID
jgi:hypothetical protein